MLRKKVKGDEFFNMDDTKWDAMIKEATDKGHLSNMKECEDILEDMLHWDKLLPDEIKQKVEAKFNELGDMCEKGELEPEQAYELFKEFEDKMVAECTELMEAEVPKKVELDDPPGEGPVLRWESRIVFAPGGDAWHPKNRKVKLSVTVKELGLSRHAFRRLREAVGERYNAGKDELTMTSERFKHREENRKDCLRTLYAIIKEAMKADGLAENARNAYVEGRLKANPQFVERLKRKTEKLRVAA
uniref:Small ribosomal subunit protein mS35 mitochondrial conserved domain-containing protein n=1 Tax=Arundo donax TaxID=35708 RepID=A0A0A9DJ16_ARUDO